MNSEIRHALPLLERIPKFMESLRTAMGISEVAWVWILYILVAFAIAYGLSAIAIYAAYFEKVLLTSARKRDNKVSNIPLWFLQPIFSFKKLMLKHDSIVDSADRPIFKVSPYVIFIAPVLALSVLPLGTNFMFSNFSCGVMFAVAFLGLSSLGMVTGGYASNSKFALLGSMRAASQYFSYQLPLVLSVLAITTLVGSSFQGQGMQFSKIVEFQKNGLWLITLQPVGFLLFFTCMLISTNTAPFDIPNSSELAGGYHAEYSGMRFGFIMLGKYSSLIVFALFGALLFLGGWNGPPSIDHLLKTDQSLLSSLGLILVCGFWILVIGILGFLAFKGIRSIFNNITSANLWFSIFSILGLAIILLHILGSSIEIPILHLEPVWLILKVIFLVFAAIVVRFTFPRLRADQLTTFAWKYMLPIAIVNLFLTAIIVVYLKGN